MARIFLEGRKWGVACLGGMFIYGVAISIHTAQRKSRIPAKLLTERRYVGAVPPAKKPSQAEPMAEVALNKLAGRMLKEARGSVKAIVFAPALSRRLGRTVSESSLSSYETGRRPVPSAVLLAG